MQLYMTVGVTDECNKNIRLVDQPQQAYLSAVLLPKKVPNWEA